MRPADQVEARKPLTRRQIIQLMLDQEGRCGCGCGVKLDPMGEQVIDEHVIALELTGSNDLSNRSLWRKPCSVAKTKGDAKAIAKAKRLAGETGNGPKKQIRSRGFNKTMTRRFDGSVVARSAGSRHPETSDGEAALLRPTPSPQPRQS